MFATLEQTDVNEIHVFRDPDSALHALIAIHAPQGCSPSRPALGGCRFLPYDDEQSALTDVTRLARGMSYKAALAGLPFCGGKAVLIEPRHPYQRDRLYQAFGRAVESLGGRYITAMDAGTERQDLDQVARHTRHLRGYSGDGLDPAPYTALGVFAALHACSHFALHSRGLRGLHFAVQGLGHVGGPLAVMLRRAGAQLTLADLDNRRATGLARSLQAQWVPADSIYDVPCDALVPCALGAILNDDTLPRLRCQMIAGAANNQLASPAIAEQLHSKEILYAPDYVCNAGGLIGLALGHRHVQPPRIRRQVLAISKTLSTIFNDARHRDLSPSQMADQLAQQRLQNRQTKAA